MNPFKPVMDIVKDLKLDLPRETARDYLRRAGLRGRCLAKKPLMSTVNRLQRGKCARQRAGYSFNEVLFIDEKKWVCINKGPNWVWRPVGMRFLCADQARGWWCPYGLGDYISETGAPLGPYGHHH